MKALFTRTFLFLLMTFVAAILATSQVSAGADPPPFSAANIRFEDEVLSVLVEDNFAYVGLESQMIVLDVTHPLAPTTLSALHVPVSALAKADNWLYTITGLNFRILDVDNPVLPVLVSETQFTSLGTQYDLAVQGEYAYIGYQRGLAAIDVSNPYSPTLVGNLLYTLGQVRSVDVSKDPSGKSERVFAYRRPGRMLRLAVYSVGRIRIVDVTDPADMFQVYSCEADSACITSFSSFDMALENAFAYVLGTIPKLCSI